MAGEEKKLIELTPEQEALLTRSAKEKEEADFMAQGKAGNLGVPGAIFAEILSHPDFATMKDVAGGFNANTAPRIVSVIAAKIKAADDAKLKEAEQKKAEEEAARANRGGTPELKPGGGGAGGGSEGDYKKILDDPNTPEPLKRIIRAKGLAR